MVGKIHCSRNQNLHSHTVCMRRSEFFALFSRSMSDLVKKRRLSKKESLVKSSAWLHLTIIGRIKRENIPMQVVSLEKELNLISQQVSSFQIVHYNFLSIV